ncbi:hypothetical protein JYT99_02970 [bacterium AH-315-E09]|nr:hypothetical protein [bacterium AH-315-L21]MBN4074873.1 hypothetical protein [bacterium AH-315-E09]
MMNMHRQHYLKRNTIAKLWEKDKEELLYLPEYEYDGFRYEEKRINKYGCIQIDKNRYSVSPELVGEKVSVKIYFNKIKVYKERIIIAEFSRNYGEFEEIYDWKQYLKLMSVKPGAIEHTKFYNQIPKLWREHLLKVEKKEKKKVLLLLKEAIDRNELENIDTALELSQLYGRTDADSIRQCYYNLTIDDNSKAPCNINIDVPIMNYDPPLSAYDNLLEKEVMQ